MNDQSTQVQSPLDALAEPDQPFPTIEPAMAELLTLVDDPVVDAPPAAPDGDANSIAWDAPAPEAESETELAAYVGRPISAVMDRTLWTVHAEDSIEKVEGILGQQNLTSAPVVGSNGAIIGMISNLELAQFHAEGKNVKAVQAWEIARIRTFEVGPRDTVEDVAKLMAENKVDNISVTESGRLIGIVSAQELMLDMLNTLPEAGGQ